MNEKTDAQLLRAYAEHRSEPAFAELVRRHVDFVYSAALRMVNDPHLAEDVTQAVFVALAQHAAQLTQHPVLSGWLHRTAQNLAAQTVRTNVRRSVREQEAVAMNALLTAEPHVAWEQIAPQLDAALGELNQPDRDALLLRYFERKSAHEMAQTLGISAEAAQKRVNRAVERLRELFAKRGVTVGASGLVVAISTSSVQAAPVGLALTISAVAAIAGPTVATATVTATTAIAMTTLQKTLVTLALAAAVGTGIYEVRQAARLREELQGLQLRQAPLAERLAELDRDYGAATNQLAALKRDNERLNRNTAELLKLRGEVARLREDTRALTPAEANAKDWAARVALLKKKLEQMPARKIPELQFITEKDWANASWDADLTTEDGVREALSKVREEAENTFMNRLRSAIKKYADSHDGMLPSDTAGLKDYFEPPIQEAEAMLKRYTLMQTGKLSDDRRAALARLTTYADPDYDSNHQITLNGASGGRFNRIQGAVDTAARAYAAANNGRLPGETTDLTPYLDQPIEAAAIQKYLKQFVANPPPPEAITLGPVLKAYSSGHDGNLPENPFDLVAYLTTPEQEAALLKVENIPPDMALLMPAVKAYAGAHKGLGPKDFPDLQPYLTTAEQRNALQRLEQLKKPGAR